MVKKLLLAACAAFMTVMISGNVSAAGMTYSCVCIGTSASSPYCGNNAVGGDYGNVKSGMTASEVIASYGPERIGPRKTGWACMVKAVYDCACAGTPSIYACGNDAVGGDGGQVRKNISLADVIASYGPNRIGHKATGWACIPASN